MNKGPRLADLPIGTRIHVTDATGRIYRRLTIGHSEYGPDFADINGDAYRISMIQEEIDETGYTVKVSH